MEKGVQGVHTVLDVHEEGNVGVEVACMMVWVVGSSSYFSQKNYKNQQLRDQENLFL